MKQARLICMIALAGAVAIGCGLEEAGSAATSGTGATGGNGNGTGGSGGSGGTGATGGLGEGECTNDADQTVYAGVEYTNVEGSFTGTKAVSEIGSDCVLGNSQNEAPNLTSIGCAMFVGFVLADPSDENIENLANCVVDCIVEQPVDLSEGCLDCYGKTVACGAAFCAGKCADDTDDPACIACRCGDISGVNCVEDFDTCSGLEPNTTCP
jgi:hypothetical protein